MSKHSRWYIVLAAVLVLSFALSGCAPKAAAPAPAPTQAPAAEPTAAPAVEPTAAPAAEAAKPAAVSPEEGEKLVRTLDPKALPAGWKVPATIAHVTNYLVHEWYQNETKGEAARAGDYGIKFSIDDANLDLQKSLAAVDDNLTKGTNALVFTPANEKASGPTITKAVKTMPVVCEGSPTDGCLTLVSIDDFKAGEQVGVWAGNYAKENLGGKAIVLDVGLPALSTTVARSEGFAAGLKSVLPDAVIAQSVDGSGLKDKAVTVAADALTAHPDVNIIFGINDDSALGGLQAYEAAGMDTKNLLVVGFGCEGKACKNALMEGGPYKVSAAMFPEYQGRLLIDAAIAAYNGQPLPAHIVAPSTPVTKDNLAEFYTKDGDNYLPIFEAMAKLPLGAAAPAATSSTGATPEDNEKLVRTLDPKALPAGWKIPATVAHVTNYLVHEWYQNETKGEAARAGDYGIKFSIDDANLDLQKSLAAVDDNLTKGTNALVFTPANEKASGPTITKAVKTMPVVCEGSPTDGCLTLVSIDDFKAGEQVGVWAGNYAKENFGGKAVVLDVGLPALSTTVARSEGFAAGLKSVLPDAVIAQSVDGSGLKDKAVTVAADALTAHPDVNIIFGINDDSALGGLQAYEAAGMDTKNLLVVGFGCEGKACKNALMEGGPYKVSAAMFPEYQGRLLIDAAIAAYSGAELPAHIVAPSLPVTKDNLAEFYTKDGDNYLPIFEAMAKLPVK